jgi:hypothetical protein
LSSPAIPFITAGMRPELFSGSRAYSLPKVLLITVLCVLVVAGLALRANGLSSEGLSEDELNKLAAVNEYRSQGLSSANGEHPLLMKALLTVSVVTADAWDRTSFVSSHPELNIPVETSLRIPSALFGACTPSSSFWSRPNCLAGKLDYWLRRSGPFDPLVIGYNRIAKEDTFLVFFFLLANFFWLRGPASR